MNTQQAYERMRAWLTRPGARRAISQDGSCYYEVQYGGDDGMQRCAVGALLSDEAIQQLKETGLIRKSLGTVMSCKSSASLMIAELDGIKQGFLRAAQALHDNEDSWVGGKFRVDLLDHSASIHGLEVITDDELTTVG